MVEARIQIVDDYANYSESRLHDSMGDLTPVEVLGRARNA